MNAQANAAQAQHGVLLVHRLHAVERPTLGSQFFSERHGIPVILRPTTRVCHARQPVAPGEPDATARKARFVKDPSRWAATPRHRYVLHRELNAKIERIRTEAEGSPFNGQEPGEGPLGIIAAGHAWAKVRDVLREEGRRLPVLKIGTPFPLPLDLVRRFIDANDRVIVLEEPAAAIETQIPDRTKVEGRLTGRLPPEGELASIHAIDTTRAETCASAIPRPRS